MWQKEVALRCRPVALAVPVLVAWEVELTWDDELDAVEMIFRPVA